MIQLTDSNNKTSFYLNNKTNFYSNNKTNFYSNNKTSFYLNNVFFIFKDVAIFKPTVHKDATSKVNSVFPSEVIT